MLGIQRIIIMKTSKTAPLTSLLRVALSATTYAAKDNVSIIEDGIISTVDRSDDGRSKLYVVNFDDDDVTSKYRFNTDGFVTNLKVGTERYRVVYRTNGDLRRVHRTNSGARTLHAEDIEDVDKGGLFTRRRLYACHDCEEAWDGVCDEGVPSVCSIVGYGSPLTDAATASMENFFKYLRDACSLYTGTEACVDQCECERFLAISLEWYSVGDLDLHVYESSGVEVYYTNRNTDVGFLDNDTQSGPDSEPENYPLYSGLFVDTDEMRCDYIDVVELDSGSGSTSWKGTATSNGEELRVQEGDFDFANIGGDSSASFTATVSENIDNGCERRVLWGSRVIPRSISRLPERSDFLSSLVGGKRRSSTTLDTF